MADILTPIDARSVVTDISRSPTDRRDVSSWFKTETLELNFGETSGRPDSDITLQREYLARFLETGWVIDAVLDKGDSGHWVMTGGSVITNKSATLGGYSVDGSSYAISDPDFSSLSNNNRQIRGDGTIEWSPSGTGFQNSSHPIQASISTSTPVGDAPAYWTAYQKIRLKRRRLVAEYVMQTMIDSFNDAYNSGREIEDSRYNQIVSLYTLMLQRSEAEGNEIVSGAIDVSPLLEEIKAKILGSMDKTEESSDRSSKFIVEDAIAEINRKFDSLIAAERAREITVGVYSTTVWPTVEAGYERQRADAILKARAEGEKAVFDIRSSSSQSLAAAGAQLAQVAASIAKQADERKVTVVELRNSVLKWMLDYIGGRQESYPELGDQQALVNQLGFSVGSAGSVL